MKDITNRLFDETMAAVYHKDPELAMEVLDSIVADGAEAEGELLIALRQMTKAFGGAARVAEKANLNRTQIYRTLSKKGNPSVSSLSAILRAMGLRLSVRPLGD